MQGLPIHWTGPLDWITGLAIGVYRISGKAHLYCALSKVWLGSGGTGGGPGAFGEAHHCTVQ